MISTVLDMILEGLEGSSWYVSLLAIEMYKAIKISQIGLCVCYLDR